MEFNYVRHDQVVVAHGIGSETENVFIESIKINELIISMTYFERAIRSSTKTIPNKTKCIREAFERIVRFSVRITTANAAVSSPAATLARSSFKFEAESEREMKKSDLK